MGFMSCLVSKRLSGLLYFYICNLAELFLVVGATQLLVVSPELCIRKNVVCKYLLSHVSKLKSSNAFPRIGVSSQ